MSFFLFLTVVQGIIAAALVAVVLMQRSEGGGLGIGGGGSPAGLMSARGAADFMTRATTILATLFVVISIVLATVAVGATSGREIDDSLDRTVEAGTDDAAAALIGAPAAGEESSADQQAPATEGSDPLEGAAN